MAQRHKDKDSIMEQRAMGPSMTPNPPKSIPAYHSEEFDIGVFKEKLNNFMMMHAPADLCIGECEAIMERFCKDIVERSSNVS